MTETDIIFSLTGLVISLTALIISGLAFYYSHLQGPKIEIHMKKEKDQENNDFTFNISPIHNVGPNQKHHIDQQHISLTGSIDIMLINEGNRTGSIVPFDSKTSEYNNFEVTQTPDTGLIRIAIERGEKDIQTTLPPGESSVFKLRVMARGVNNRLHHEEADKLLGKKINVNFSFVATKRNGFEKKSKEFKLIVIDRRETKEN